MDYQLGPGPLQVDQNTIDEKIKGDIGIVENGDVATHAIPSGYYVIWKGDLYVAKTDISSGTTLSTSNLNARPKGLGAEVAALRSEAIASTGITLSATNVTSDDYILSLDPGVYCIAGNKSTYLPTRYGTLTKYNTGSSTYGYCMVVSAEGGLYYVRHFNGNVWHENEWRQLALKSSVDTLNSNISTINSHRMSCLKKNTTGSSGTLTFTFNGSGARYSAILFITQNSNNNGVYLISGKANNSFVVVKLGGTYTDSDLTVDQSTGKISVPVGTWSQVTLLHDAADGEFT